MRLPSLMTSLRFALPNVVLVTLLAALSGTNVIAQGANRDSTSKSKQTTQTTSDSVLKGQVVVPSSGLSVQDRRGGVRAQTNTRYYVPDDPYVPPPPPFQTRKDK